MVRNKDRPSCLTPFTRISSDTAAPSRVIYPSTFSVNEDIGQTCMQDLCTLGGAEGKADLRLQGYLVGRLGLGADLFLRHTRSKLNESEAAVLQVDVKDSQIGDDLTDTAHTRQR